ncbi:MAG: SH3 domain-containing protein [Clostridia bacterium]|nr:SH3 domain-containing protein [Clostridia bacterium]
MRIRILKKTICFLCILCISLSLLAPFARAQSHPNTYKNTGDAAADIVAVANTQIGYNGTNGRTKYTSVYRETDPTWSGAFISWCAAAANVRGDVIPQYTSALAMMRYFQSEKQFVLSPSRGGSYTPKAGDLGFISELGNPNKLARAGIVQRVNGGKVYLIEGDTSVGVALGIYSLDSDRLMGYVSPKYQLNVALFETGTYITTDPLNFRAAPNTDAERYAVLEAGTTVQVTYVRGNWGQITYGGKTGWICMDYCQPYLEKAKTVNWLVADISQWNAPNLFNWTALKNSGVRAVIIRVGGRFYGGSRSLFTDDEFAVHYRAAKKAGLYVGVYFFSYAMTTAEAKAEADLTIRMLKNNNCQLDMPVFIDIEDYTESNGTDYAHVRAGKKVCTNVVDAFCSTIEDAGYYAGIYASKSFAEDLLAPEVFENRAVWIAMYESKCTYPRPYDMWQYTRYGRISGFNGNLDLNRCYVNFPALIAERTNKLQPPTQVVSEPEVAVKPEYMYLEPIYSPGDMALNTYGDHRLSDRWVTTAAPTCLKEGVAVRRCTDCGLVLQTRFAPKKDHTASADQIILGRTDILPGTVLTSAQLALIHPSGTSMYADYEKKLYASGGMLLTYCKDCKKVLTVKYEYNNCIHPSVNTLITQGTCTSEGVRKRVCTLCKRNAEADLLSTVPHSVSLPAFAGNSRCTDVKSYQTVCTQCGTLVFKDHVAAYAHRYDTVSANPPLTFTAAGVLTLKCAVCGDTKTETVQPPKYADLDADGHITATDARSALRISVGLDAADPAQKLAGDLNASGDVDAVDARLILRLSVDLENAETLMKKYYYQDSLILFSSNDKQQLAAPPEDTETTQPASAGPTDGPAAELPDEAVPDSDAPLPDAAPTGPAPPDEAVSDTPVLPGEPFSGEQPLAA